MRFKMNSIFMRILIPLLIVIIIQTIASYIIIVVSGTVSKINDNSISMLTKNVENRQHILQNMLTENWSFLGGCYNQINDDITYFLEEKNVTVNQIIDDRALTDELIELISEELLVMQRANISNGIYFILSNGKESGYGVSDMTFSGVYFRDLDPFTNPTNYSDIFLEIGKSEISSNYDIALDSNWRESFIYSTDKEENNIWDSYFKPYIAYTEHPELSSYDLGYWNLPANLGDSISHDFNSFISYSLPIMIDGVFVGIIGSEIQLDMLTDIFPAKDMGNSGGGYMLVTYNYTDSVSENGDINCNIIASTGNHINLLRNAGDNVVLKSQTAYSGIYRIDTGKYIGDDLYCSAKQLKLYNSYTPFANEYWALVSADTGNALFGDSIKLNRSIIISSVLSFIIASICVYLVTRLTTDPLRRVAEQISLRDFKKLPIIISPTGVLEIDELSATINELNSNQQKIESKLREERERYLIALESCSDIILEYTVKNDTLETFYFRDDLTPAEVYSNVTLNFKQSVSDGYFCHPDDQKLLIDLFSGKIFSAEYRVYDNMRIKWLSAKTKCVYNNDGYLVRIIGSIHDITDLKNKEITAREASHRDPVTGFYNRDFGEKMIGSYMYSVKKKTDDYCLCVLDFNKFRSIEELYGSMFCNIILSETALVINDICKNYDIVIRAGKDEFIILLANTSYHQAVSYMEKLAILISGIYAGESTKLSVSIGVIAGYEGKNYNDLLDKARRTVSYIKMSGLNSVMGYNDVINSGINIKSSKFEPSGFTSIAKVLDYDDDNIVNFALNVCERTMDITSAINIMLIKIARKLPLKRIMITEVDSDFNTSFITNQWCAPDTPPCYEDVLKSPISAFNELKSYLNSDGTLIYNTIFLSQCSPNIRKLLRVPEGKAVSGFACVIYMTGNFSGIALFEASDTDYEWGKYELDTLREVTKVFSTHINRSKSDIASKAKSEFLSRMSHEVRTPMNAIIGMTGLAMSCTDDSEKVKNYLYRIDISSKYLLSLVNDILDMSGIESGKIKLAADNFDIIKLLRDIDIMLRPLAERKNIDLVIEKDIKDVFLLGDSYHLSQVLVNLVNNAIKFTNPKGMVILSAIQIKNNKGSSIIKFSVKDNGIGISKENIHRIFNSFEQVDENSSDKFGGTGLGLSISSNIIQLMGGRLEVISEPDIGSEFFFTLSLNYGNNPNESKLASNSDYSDFFNGKRVLIIEDNDLNIEIIKSILEIAGFETEYAKNGREGVIKFSDSEPGYYNVILMDIRMPVMNGLEATREIRKMNNRSDALTIPIIATTANAFDEDMKKSIESGMNGHIAKPIDTLKLYTLLEKLIFNS